jgi:hypothetical protein
MPGSRRRCLFRPTLGAMWSLRGRRRLVSLALVALSLAALGGAMAAYGFYALHWGCPSTSELQRPLSTGEVKEAFAGSGLALEPAHIPVALPAGAIAYRREAEGATLFVVVCAGICPEQLPDVTNVVFQSDEGVGQRMRRGWGFLHVFVWAADADHRSAQQLGRRLQPLMDDLSRTISPDDRCYVR